MSIKMDKDLKKHVVKTGTTTIGIVCKEGIVLAADKRASYGSDSGVSYIAGKDQEKISEVTPDIVVTTAGVASDTRRVIKIVRSELKLKELKSRTKPTIKQAANLFSTIMYQNIRQPSMIPAITHFLLAGRDEKGFHLYDISPDGFLQEIKTFAVSGSGSTSVNPILDTYYKKDLSIKEATELIKKGISAAMGRDPATGEGRDIYIITKDKIEELENKRVVINYEDIKKE